MNLLFINYKSKSMNIAYFKPVKVNVLSNSMQCLPTKYLPMTYIKVKNTS